MRAKEIRERNDEELLSLLDDQRAQLFQLRLKNATHQLDDTGKIHSARREIARINTVLGERARAGKAAQAPSKGDEE